MNGLLPGDLIQGTIVRISNNGNGMLDYGAGEISIGPIKPEAVGQEIDATVLDEDHAFCENDSIQTEYYRNAMVAQMGELINDLPEESVGLGELIDVKIEGVNSSGHGPATYKFLFGFTRFHKESLLEIRPRSEYIGWNHHDFSLLAKLRSLS